MQLHRFKPGARVHLLARRFGGDSGIFVIVRQLPETGGTNQYRIRCETDGHERVVLETDLE
jgi:hypothetical protein